MGAVEKRLGFIGALRSFRRTISDGWFRLRNRILASPRFQRWAARFPLTQFIARQRARALFDLCAGFVYSQVLHAAVRVGLFEALAVGPKTAAELAPLLELPQDATLRLLDAATSLKLVERRDGDRFGLGIHGASLVGNPAASEMVKHHALLYRDLADPVALLRGEHSITELGQFWSYSRSCASPIAADQRGADYSRLMASSLQLFVEDILDAYPLDRHHRLLDIGGGNGTFVEAVAARVAKLSLVLFDLPEVAARARARLAQTEHADRIAISGGDLFCDALPEGADLVSLVRVLHDHDDPQALEILRKARRALRSGGVILVAEPLSNTAGAEPIGDAYFGFYLLAMGQGRPRTFFALRTLLREAGFVRVRELKTRRPMLIRLTVADVE